MESKKELAPQIKGELVVATPHSIYTNPDGFNQWLKMAEALSKAKMVPPSYQGTTGMPNCLIAIEIANRLGESPVILMQNMDVVKGKPFFAAKYLAGLINGCGKYSPLRFDIEELGETDATIVKWEGPQGNKRPVTSKLKINNIRCRARCIELKTKEELAGDWVSIEMAVNEGWYTRAGSKWPTMPHKMLRYRATSFWVNIFDPGISMGFATRDEIEDIEIIDESSVINDLNERVDDGQPGTAPEPANPPDLDDEII